VDSSDSAAALRAGLVADSLLRHAIRTTRPHGAALDSLGQITAMKNFIWRQLAKFLARPTVFRLIKWWAFRHPYVHLPGYMERWHVVPFSWKLPFAVRLHHILRADVGRDQHDHPWDWRTIILDGWYIEEDVFGSGRVMGHSPMNTRTDAKSAETFHRITDVSEGGVWTLFITGKYRNKWGFMTGSPPRKIYYRNYFLPEEILPGSGEIK
jgi:hypothetical protein